MAGVFISYRRDDCAGHAGRLYDRLVERIGEASVFMDVDAIEPGADFSARIAEALGACKLVIVLIGDDWLEIADADGRRRLEDPDDLVRHEVASALRRDDVRLIPVLVEGARMPPIERLPDDLQAITRRNALELSDAGWRRDVQHLIDVVERVVLADDEPLAAAPRAPAPPAPAVLPASAPRSSFASRSRLLAGAAVVLAAAVSAVVLTTRDDKEAADPANGGLIPETLKPAISKLARTRADVPISLATRPNAITFANAGVWVLSARSPDIALLDANSSRLTKPIGIGLGGTAVTAGFDSVWVLKGNTGSLIRLDRAGGRVGSAKIRASGMPVAVVAGARAVWVGVRDGLRGTLVRVDRNDLGSQRQIAIRGGLQDIAVGKGAVWVTTMSRDSVVRVDASNMANTSEISVGKLPRGVAVGEGAVWVANSKSDSITPIDPETLQAGRAITLGFGPTRVATGGGSVWVTAEGADRLFRIDPKRREVRERIKTGRQPYALDVARGRDVWVTLLNGTGVQRVRFAPG